MRVQTKEKILKNDLVLFSNNNLQKANAITTSLNVAKAFSKEHKHVLEAIDKFKSGLMSRTVDPLQNPYKLEECEYRAVTGKNNRLVIMNKDLAMFLCMSFSGEKADIIKTAFIVRFNQMEQELLLVKEARITGKIFRNDLTDSIRDNVIDRQCPYNKYAYVTNLIYSNIFGKTAKALRIMHSCKTNDLLRNYLCHDKLAKVYAIEKDVSVLLQFFIPVKSVEMSFEKIKAKENVNA